MMSVLLVLQRYEKPREQNQDLWLDAPEFWSIDGYSSGLHGVVGEGVVEAKALG